MSVDIDAYIREFQDTVTAAGLNYEIWWVYKSQDTRPKYVDTMNRYPVFFRTSIHAHFVAAVLALSRIYETRKDSYNIPSLLRVVRNQKTLDEATLDQLDQMYNKAKPLWIKINALRNKAFGHRSVAHTVEEVFKETQVTPNELKQLVEATKELLNKLSHAWNRSGHAFNLSAREETIRLLDDLKKAK
jgi:hypothetical protein